MMTAMIFRQLFDQDSSTYSYLLADEHSRQALIIDSVETRVERDIGLIDELDLNLVYCLETHIHADHITGAGKLRQGTGCKVAASRHAATDCHDIKLGENDIVTIGNISLHVLETPGHTNTCLSFHCNDRVFTGDTLLIRGCGRTDFQSGDAGQLYDSITGKLFTLPDDTLVYPAHDYQGMTVSTIGEEKRHNPRLLLGREGFIRHMQELDLPYPHMMDVAVPGNLTCGQG